MIFTVKAKDSDAEKFLVCGAGVVFSQNDQIYPKGDELEFLSGYRMRRYSLSFTIVAENIVRSADNKLI